MLKFSTALGQSLLSAASKQAWCAAVISALGSTRRVICKRSDSDGDVWGTGTTFLDISLMGEMSIVSYQIHNLGVMTTITTQAASNLATGFAVLRIEGATSATWVEGTVGLPGSGADFILRANLTALGMGVGFNTATIIKAPSRLPDESPNSVITTLDLINTSGSAQAANFVSPMFGQVFVDGDLPEGEFPAFTLEDETPVAATVYSDASWPDGAKMFCGVLLRPPTGIPGSGALTVQVKNGGVATAASSRTLGDLTAADIQVEIVGSTGLSGTWVASLNTAITDAADIVVIGDGPAGKVWRIRGPFKQSGAAHGQLECWHYVAALQDAAGGLMGIRYMGRIAQPYADLTTPTPALRIFSAVLKSGATTIRTMQGFNSSGVLGDAISLHHYTSISTAGTNGQWDYIQGGGSAAADCTVRVVQNRAYMKQTGLISPYDLSLSITPNTSVDYYPGASGGMRLDQSGVGEREDIGVFPSWVARDMIAPTAASEQRIRVAALASMGWRNCIRKNSTKQIVAGTGVSASYAGLGTTQTTWFHWSDSGITGGMVAFGGVNRWQDDIFPGHRPSTAYYAYMLTAEPQNLDLAVDIAAQTLLILPPNTPNTWKTTTPVVGDTKSGTFHSRDVIVAGTTYKGGGLFFRRDLLRIQAWGMRDVAHGMALYPDTCPYGTEAKKYFSEVLEQNYAGINAYNAALPLSWRNAGFIMFGTNEEPDRESPWTVSYYGNSIAHQALITKSAAALQAASHVANFWISMAAAGDMAVAGSYFINFRRTDNERIESFDEVMFMMRDATLTWTAGSDVFVLSGKCPTNVAVGSRFRLSAAGVGAGAATGEIWYVVESVAARQFKLARDGDVSPIVAEFSGSTANPSCYIANQSPLVNWDFNGVSAPFDYTANATAACIHLHRAGVAGILPAVNKIVPLNATVNYAGDPKNAYEIPGA